MPATRHSRFTVAIILSLIAGCNETHAPAVTDPFVRNVPTTGGTGAPPAACAVRAALCGARAQPGPPAFIRVVSGDGQSAVSGAALPDSLVVVVVDQFENPVGGVTVNWIAAGDSGAVTPDRAITDTTGRVRARWTVGNAVPVQAVVVAVDGVAAVRLTAHVTRP